MRYWLIFFIALLSACSEPTITVPAGVTVYSNVLERGGKAQFITTAEQSCAVKKVETIHNREYSRVQCADFIGWIVSKR